MSDRFAVSRVSGNVCDEGSLEVFDSKCELRWKVPVVWLGSGVDRKLVVLKDCFVSRDCSENPSIDTRYDMKVACDRFMQAETSAENNP